MLLPGETPDKAPPAEAAKDRVSATTCADKDAQRPGSRALNKDGSLVSAANSIIVVNLRDEGGC